MNIEYRTGLPAMPKAGIGDWRFKIGPACRQAGIEDFSS